ncbi:unnamed protein product [Amoebophrya sp. A25]|nr:unnamed protein product [Amoebophrya sp. A25]|eukprot:GSA25T00009094001.1
MPRHSKNRTDLPYATAYERAEAGFGASHTELLGTDVQLPFGFCCLSLKAALNPVASPYGNIFDREFILNSLMEQKSQMKSLEKAFARQLEDEKLLKERDDFSAKRRRIEQFERQETGNEVLEDMKFSTSRVEMEVKDKKAERSNNFWVASDAPSAKKRKIQPEELKKHTSCPINPGKKLRMKDLIPVKFEVCDQEMYDGGGGRGMYCCSVTKKPITHQKVTLLKPSGYVVLEECLKTVVRPTMTCPISGVKLEESDLVPLVPGNTGFSAHNAIETKTTKLMRTAAQVNSDRSGTVGAKGYVR